MNIAVATLALASPSNFLNALNAVTGQTDGDVAYVLMTNRFYRWFAASTATPDGESVILPFSALVANPGRWIRQGPPGPAKIPPGFANFLTTGSDQLIIHEMTGTLAGGSPTETLTIETGATLNPLEPLFRPSNSIAVLGMNSADPNVQGRCVVAADNVVTANVVDVSGGNLAAIALRAYVIRNVTN